MQDSAWEQWATITKTLVNVTVLLGVIVAVVKFRVFNLFTPRFRSEITCTHTDLADGRTLFRGNYMVHNTGERPIWIQNVNLKLMRALEVEEPARPAVTRRALLG